MGLLRAFLEQVVRKGTIEIELANQTRFSVGDGSGQPVAVRFKDAAAQLRLLLNPALALGELVTDGRIVVTRGSIYELLDVLASNLTINEPPGVAQGLGVVRNAFKRLQQCNGQRRAKSNVAHHYDLDRRLYSLFLDSDWQYSCAYFENDGQGLDEAQLAKKRHIAAKLLVEPGHRLLDIGCGWGGLALYLAEFCGADVTGITLSDEQLGIAKARAVERRLMGRAKFHLQDYRAAQGRFERIVSVGMFEHVGVAYYNAYFEKVVRLLSDDGIMLLHSIGRTDGPVATNPWIAKYVFPGGHIPALSEVLPSIERAGLVVTDIEILRLHYAQTLRAWRERFVARQSEANAAYGERFCRLWEFYLAAAECGFRHGGLMVFQIQVARRQESVPLTRNYISQREAILCAKDHGRTDQRFAAE
jgi:cyclopropane-fatty-acyl-phospholipid synthase